jgi:hypothetical protein
MSVTTILVEDDEAKIAEWTDYIKEYDRETSKSAKMDLTGLGTPLVAKTKTLEEVLSLMAKSPAEVALIYAHANPTGLLARITTDANSADSPFLRGISRAWKAIDEIIPLRSGKWPKSGKPEFFIDVPKSIELFQRLREELRKLPGDYAGRLKEPSGVTDRDQADAWFDQWMDLMGKATLGGGLGETELRRVAWNMQQVRNAHYKRVEIRACNIGHDTENLNALKEFCGVDTVVAPKVTMFFGVAGVNLNPGADLDALAKQLGGFQGTRFQAATGKKTHHLNTMPGAESAMATGRRNRIFPDSGPADAIMQMTKDRPFHFHGRLFSPTAATLTRFFQANYKAGYSFKPATKNQPVGGMWTASVPSVTVPFVLPLEPAYRDLLETSN